MAEWRVAKTLGILLAEINVRSPGRSTKSDGAIGDKAHATRDSDHNPWVQDRGTGVVTARDFTNDPGHGFDSSEFADWLRFRCDKGIEKRVKYIISDRRIASAKTGWDWWKYDGANKHEKHVHVSVRSTKAYYDNTQPWGWARPEDEDDMAMTPKERAAFVEDIAKRAAEVIAQQSVEAIAKRAAELVWLHQWPLAGDKPQTPGGLLHTIAGRVGEVNLEVQVADGLARAARDPENAFTTQLTAIGKTTTDTLNAVNVFTGAAGAVKQVSGTVKGASTAKG